MPSDRFVCTKADPWTPAKADRAQHPDAREVESTCDCCAQYICPWCKLRFKVELPE